MAHLAGPRVKECASNCSKGLQKDGRRGQGRTEGEAGWW